MVDTDQFSDQEILAKTIWGEARGEIPAGQQAVACVILNRVALNGWRGHDIRSVCLKPFQFSCWLQNDPNRTKMLEVTADSDQIYANCLDIAASAITGTLIDNTNGATSYFAASMKTPPAWANGLQPCQIIGNHLFFTV